VARNAKSPYCPRCRTRRFKQSHPITWAYNKLRSHARARGKPFTLTREEFREFCLKTDYHKLSGSSKYSLQVDRIESGLGYHRWNIRAITTSENSRRSFVPFFSEERLSFKDREAYYALERAYSEKLEHLVNEIPFPPGSENFWLEFNRCKAILFAQPDE
jgi:hypothetical protein